MFSLIVINTHAQTVIFDENFSSGQPTGWNNTEASGTNGKWEFNDPQSRGITAGNFSGNFAILDSDGHGNGSSQKSRLTTPGFDASTYTSLTLEYDYQYRDYDGPEFCKIQVYNGSSWSNVTTYTIGDDNYPNANHISIDITSAANYSTNTKVRFFYKGSYDYWFALDNVKIYGTLPVAEHPPTGPGGIGSQNGASTLKLWLDANTVASNNGLTITNWSDVSGNGNNFTSGNGASYLSSGTNGYPTFNFNGNSNYFERPYSADLSPTSLTMFTASKSKSNGNYKCLISNRDDPSGTATHGYILYASPSSNEWQFWTGNTTSSWHNNPRTASTTNSWAGIMFQFDESTNSKLINSSNNGSSSSNSSMTRNTSKPIRVGAGKNESTPDYYFYGEIGEIIMFDEVLSTVETIIVQNYLAAKYNYSLSLYDYFNRDNSGSGNFDHKVAGIGKATDGSSHSSSKGTGIVQIKNPSSLNNDDFLFWGENQMNSDYSFSTTTDYKERLNTQWRVSHRNNVGSVTLSVEASDIDISEKQTCAALYLIVSSSSNFTTKTEYSLSLLDGVYSADNVVFNDGDYFSFEYQDLIVISQTGFIGGSGISNAPNTSDECYKLLVVAGANFSYNITENANVREIEVQANATFSVATDKFLQVTGDIINNGTISVDENASLVQLTTGVNSNSGSGTYEITRSGNTNSYIYNIWSSPIQNAGLTTVFNDANPCDMWAFEELTQSWKADFNAGFSTTCNGNPVTYSVNSILVGGDGLMDVTRGYFIPGNLSAARIYSGQVNNGDYSTAVVTTTLGNPGGTDWADDDWNLVGNPYPSGLSADSFWKENAVLNQRITDALYFWDEADTNGGYNSTSDYASWNLSGGVESGNSTKEPLGNIASGQGFWVVASNTSNIAFTNNMRVTSNDQFFKKGQNDQHNAWFRFSSPSNYKNNILIGYNSHSTDGIDEGYDAHKLIGNGHVRFASVMNQDEFVIQSMAPFTINETKIIPITVFTDESGIHSFTNYKKKQIPGSLKIYLRDLVLGTDYDLSTGAYDVSLLANTTYDQRFQLVFVNELDIKDNGHGGKDGINPPDTTGLTTSITASITNPDFLFIQEDGIIKITNENGFTGNIQIIDISGKQVYAHFGIENSLSQTINLNGIAQGTYFLSITNDHTILYNKQFVK